MATGTRAMVSKFFARPLFYAIALTLALTSYASAFASDALHTEDWKTLRPGHLAYLKGDGGGEEKATVCRSIKGAMNPDASRGCSVHAIGSVVTIDAKTDVNDPFSGSPIVAISGQGFSGYIEALLLEPAIPLHSRFRVERETVALHKHLQGMDPFSEDLTLKSGALIEVLAQSPYQDGMWVKLLVLDGRSKGFVGWAYPNELDIFFYQ